MTNGDYLGVVEAAYAQRSDALEWATGIARAMCPILNQGPGLFARAFPAMRHQTIRTPCSHLPVASSIWPPSKRGIRMLSCRTRFGRAAVAASYGRKTRHERSNFGRHSWQGAGRWSITRTATESALS